MSKNIYVKLKQLKKLNKNSFAMGVVVVVEFATYIDGGDSRGRFVDTAGDGDGGGRGGVVVFVFILQLFSFGFLAFAFLRFLADINVSPVTVTKHHVSKSISKQDSVNVSMITFSK